MEPNTQDLSKFGYRELSEAARLLNAYCETSPEFLEESIAIEFNPNSGCVFLTDGDYNVGMMNGDDLEQWINCPECGMEGFLEEMVEDGQDCCIEYLEEAGLIDELEKYRRQVRPGTTSQGSCKLDDIVQGVWELIPEELLDEFNECDEDEPDYEEARNDIFSEICDHLDEIAPDGLYFGASEGDGADYGFWQTETEEEA